MLCTLLGPRHPMLLTHLWGCPSRLARAQAASSKDTCMSPASLNLSPHAGMPLGGIPSHPARALIPCVGQLHMSSPSLPMLWATMAAPPHCRCLPSSAASNGFGTECSRRKGRREGRGGGRKEEGLECVCQQALP